MKIPAEEALRLAVHLERRAHAETLERAARAERLVHDANIAALLRRNGLDPFSGAIVTEEGQPYPLGTVLDPAGNPVPDPTPAKE